MSLDVLLLCPPPSMSPPRVSPRHAPVLTAIVAAALRAAGHRPSISDQHLESPSGARLVADVLAAAPDLVLLMTLDDNRQPPVELLRSVAQVVRGSLEGTPLVGFGRLNETAAREVLDGIPDMETLIHGEPEFGAVRVADALEADRNAALADLPGVMKRGETSRPQEHSRRLVGSPPPAWDLLDKSRYPFSPHQQTDSPVFPVFASRGCPFPCFFCETSRQPRWTPRPPEEVVAELWSLQEQFGTDSVFFADANFVVDRTLTQELCESLRRNGPPLRWSCMVRTDAVDEELLESMASAGCWNVLFGVESLDEGVLRATGKNLDPRTVGPAVRAARRVGIEVIVSAMIGLPGDSPAGVRRTVEGLVRLEPDYAQFFIVQVPDSESPAGGRFVSEWEGGKRDFDGRVFAPEAFSDVEQLRALQRWAYRRFYLRPRYVGGRVSALLRKDRPAAELLRLARGGLLAARMAAR